MNQADLQNELFSWTQRNNLSLIVDFHNEIKQSLQEEIASMNNMLEEASLLSDDEKIALQAKKRIYLDTFEPYLRNNTFLMMVSHLEEWLLHTWKHHAPATELFESKGSIGRFKPVLKAIGVDLSRSGSWMFVKGCQDIRSCLLHANGRVSLNRNPERIQNFVARYGDMIRIDADRLVLEEKFLSCFQDAVEELIGSVGSA